MIDCGWREATKQRTGRDVFIAATFATEIIAMSKIGEGSSIHEFQHLGDFGREKEIFDVQEFINKISRSFISP